MGKVKICFCCAVFLLFFISLSFSETILLKSGQKIEGRVAEKTDQYVKVDFMGVDIVYYNDEVASITQGVSNSGKTASPQLESLYQAYTSSLNVPQKQKEEKIVEAPKLVASQAAVTNQKTSAMTPNTDLSQLPPEYQKMMQGVTQQGISGVQSSQQGDSNPAVGVSPDGFISQLPSEYQEMIKTAMAKQQAAKSDPSGKK